MPAAKGASAILGKLQQHREPCLARLTNRINAALAQMLGLVRNDSERQECSESASKLRAFVSERHRELQRFLKGGEIKPAAFGSNDVARLTGWEPCVDHGNPVFQKLEEDGKPLLLIRAAAPETAGSWRLRIHLPQGRYSFKGKARWEGGAPMTNAQVRLRIAGRELGASAAFPPKQWQDLACDFEEFFGGQDMELICEMKGGQGEVWFDSRSLQIERIKAYPPSWEPGIIRAIQAFP